MVRTDRFRWAMLLIVIGGTAAASEDVPPADVRVANLDAVKFNEASKWRESPPYLRGAKLYEKQQPDTKPTRHVEFEVTEGGVVMLAASWEFDGRRSGDWAATSISANELIRRGWTPIARIVRVGDKGGLDRHLLLRRVVAKGERFKQHTRKYTPPRIIVPSAESAADVMAAPPLLDEQGRLVRLRPSAHALNKEKIAAAEIAADEIGVAEVDVQRYAPILLGSDAVWKNRPAWLDKATYYGKRTIEGEVPYVEFEVKNDGLMLLAATWSFDGNTQGDWYEERLTAKQIERNGWTPVAHIVRVNDKREDVPHVLYRRVVHAGEKYRFRTRKYAPPLVMLVDPVQVKAALAAPVLEIASNDLDALPKPAFRAPKGENAVWLAAHEGGGQHELTLAGHLSREIIRQAVLIAAREELSCLTRDEMLGEWVGVEEGVAPPIEVATTVYADHTVGITLFRRVGEADDAKAEILWDEELYFPADNLLEPLVTELEALSRTKLAKALQAAGYKGERVEWTPAGKLADDTEPLLAEMNFAAQFDAVRQVHQQIRKEGESPYRLAALVRGYANLGVLTETYWSPMSKVFKARALLYAQRLAARVPDAPAVLWYRCYARALVGRHRAAVEDFDAAEALVAARRELGRESPPLPGWAAAAAAFARFDRPKLDEIAKDESTASLVHLLKLLTVEKSGPAQVSEAAQRLLEDTPDCYRAIEAVAGCQVFGLKRVGAALGPHTAAEHLPQRLNKINGLPDRVKAANKKAKEAEGEKLVDARVAMIQTLRDTGGADADPQELSWSVLAFLVEELSFNHAWREISFLHHILNTESDARRKLYMPLVRQPERRLYFEALGDDREQAADALTKLVETIDRANLTPAAEEMVDNFSFAGRQKEFQDLKRLTLRHGDDIYRDLEAAVRARAVNDRFDEVRELYESCPNVPVAVAAVARNDWEFHRQHAAMWEVRYPDVPEVLAAIADGYEADENFDGAERCLRQAIRVSPDSATYFQLARMLYKMDRHDDWRKLLEEFLKTPNYGLEHARVNHDIALYLMDRREWDEARPYADKAAESGAGWGLQVAAGCAEARGDWELAERYYRAMSTRYAGEPAWHFFCARTGKGDAKAASDMVKQFAEQLPDGETNADRIITAASYYLLDGQLEKSLQLYQRATRNDAQAYVLWRVALIADELGNVKERDDMLKRIASATPSGSNPAALVSLAQFARDDLAGGGKGVIDPKWIETALADSDVSDKVNFYCYLGKYLERRGNEEDAVRFWIQCMAQPRISWMGRTLAGAELLERKVTFAEYRDRLLGQAK